MKNLNEYLKAPLSKDNPVIKKRDRSAEKKMRFWITVILISFVLLVISLLIPGYFAEFELPEKSGEITSLVLVILFILGSASGIVGFTKNVRERLLPSSERGLQKQSASSESPELPEAEEHSSIIENIFAEDIEERLEAQIHSELESELDVEIETKA